MTRGGRRVFARKTRRLECLSHCSYEVRPGQGANQARRKMMKKYRRPALFFALFAVVSMLAFSLTLSASTQKKKSASAKAIASQKPSDDPREGVKRAIKQMKKKDSDPDAHPSSILIPDEEEGEEGDDPDLPPWMAGKIDKEASLRLRGDYIDMLRGRPIAAQDDPRQRAIQQLEKQEAQMKLKMRFGITAPI